VATDEDMNELIMRSEEEFQKWQQMDQVRAVPALTWSNLCIDALSPSLCRRCRLICSSVRLTVSCGPGVFPRRDEVACCRSARWTAAVPG
jgi:hypothetical protein